MRIKNLTNSPYVLVAKDGEKVTLPARGEIEIDPHPMHAPYYRLVGYFKISDSDKKPVEDSKETLRKEYLLLSGSTPDKRWNESRLRAEIDNLLGA